MAGILCVLICSMSIYCCEPSETVTDLVEPESPAGVVVFLHGAGESGPEARQVIEDLLGGFSKYPNLRFVFPTASARPFKPFPWNGQMTNVWYDMEELTHDAVENVSAIDDSAAQLGKLVEEQISSGIPKNKICVVGFSNGAGMALHFGYEYVKNLGCVGAISGYLPTTSALYQKLRLEQNDIGSDLPPLYLAYGGGPDFMIPSKWTEDTAEAFESAGVAVTRNFHSGASNFLTDSDVRDLFEFVQRSIS